ncbi:MAG: sugar phosphate isomerase/epimerase [Pseudomonadota bacterium]
MTFAYQLYSSRNFTPLGDTLRMVADLGYAGVEGYGALLADADMLAALEAGLKDSGLAMRSSHVALDDVERDPAGTIAIARRLGMEQVHFPYLMPDNRPTDAAGWAAFGARCDAAAAPLRDAGLTVGWHNHDFEFRALPDGSLPFDHMMQGNDLAVELDAAWVAVAGVDPSQVIAAYADRLSAVHLKDRAPEGDKTDEDGWADLGSGSLDWPAYAAAIKATDCNHLVMEHDNPSDHRRFASVSLAAAKELWA